MICRARQGSNSAQTNSPLCTPLRKRRGKRRSLAWNSLTTARQEPVRLKVSKNRRIEACTWASGSRTTRSCASYTKPTGTIGLSSPRRARLRMPPRNRALSTCSSASLMVPFRPQSKRSLKCPGSYSPSSCENERVGECAELEQAMPIGGVARQTRHLQAEHDPGTPQADFGHQALETLAVGGTGAGLPEVTVDHDDPVKRPAQCHRALPQRILAVSTLGVLDDLAQRGLAHVEVGQARKVCSRNLLMSFAVHYHDRDPSRDD